MTTPADQLRAAAEILTEDSPVNALGTARVKLIEDPEEGSAWWISICDQHDDPAYAPRTDANGHCRNCEFVYGHDGALARQLAALVNARKSLASWLKYEADRAERQTSEDVPDCCGEEHTESGLLHIDGCGDWLTVYRAHGGSDMACHCWDKALAVAGTLLATPEAQR